MKATFCRLVSWSTDHIRSVKLSTVCFHMLSSLLNVLAYHLWVQFSKSTLFHFFGSVHDTVELTKLSLLFHCPYCQYGHIFHNITNVRLLILSLLSDYSYCNYCQMALTANNYQKQLVQIAFVRFAKFYIQASWYI